MTKMLNTDVQPREERKMVVLVADDEPVTRVMLTAALKPTFTVVQAADGREAVEKYRQLHPDLVLLDVNMPGLNGCEASKQIREIEESERRVPIVLMSAHTDEQLVLDGLSSGADDFVFKPIRTRVLLSKIQAQIIRKTSHDDLAEQRSRLLALQQETAREHFAAGAVLRNIVGRADLNHPSIRYMTSPLGSFDGDVALAAKLPSGQLRVMLSDVAGHGLPAALGTIPLSLLFYSSARQGIELGAAITDMNRQLCGILPIGLFAAAAAFEVTADGHTLRAWNGGLPDLLVRRHDTTELVRIPSENLPIGIASSDECVIRELHVEPGDAVFAMSDGLSETRNAEGEMFGVSRVNAILSADRPIEHLFSDLRSALLQFTRGRQDDDITLLAYTVIG